MNSPYLFVAGTVLLSVYGQLIIKWQTGKAGAFPTETGDRIRYLADFLTTPWVISSLLAAVLAAFAWIAALSHLELSRAYPFVSASFVLVLVLSALVFGEAMTVAKVAGALLIIAGLVIGTQGA
jgi:drug/metabolite transporter (DMT)-like permease